MPSPEARAHRYAGCSRGARADVRDDEGLTPLDLVVYREGDPVDGSSSAEWRDLETAFEEHGWLGGVADGTTSAYGSGGH